MRFKPLLSVNIAKAAIIFIAFGLFAAIHLQDPHAYFTQSWLPVALLLLAALCAYLVRPLPARLWRIAVWLGCAAIVLITLGQVAWFRYQQNFVQERMSARLAQANHAIGQHFVLGYVDVNRIKPLIQHGLIGGIFISRHNVIGKSPAQVASEIAALQALRQQAGLPPLLVTADQEGGMVSRLSPPLPWQPSLGQVLQSANGNLPQAERAARAHGAQQGRYLRTLGVSLNLSPVVDLKSPKPANLLDTHTRIADRAIASDAATTTRMALPYVQGLQAQGVGGTLKHFPGLGAVAADTHHFSATLHTPLEQLQAADWKPFQDIGAQSDAAIMLGHVKVAAVDGDNPASFSHALVHGIIRSQWQFQGLLITDDLSMAAAYDEGLCQGSIKALNAGVDLLLISFDERKIYPALHCALRAHAQGNLSARILMDSDARLRRWRARYAHRA